MGSGELGLVKVPRVKKRQKKVDNSLKKIEQINLIIREKK